jgi:hypothetical protein
VVIRRDLSPRLREESDFAVAMRDYLRLALEELSTSAKVKRRIAQALEAIGQISVEVAVLHPVVWRAALGLSERRWLGDHRRSSLYAANKRAIQRELDREFYEAAMRIYSQATR